MATLYKVLSKAQHDEALGSDLSVPCGEMGVLAEGALR